MTDRNQKTISGEGGSPSAVDSLGPGVVTALQIRIVLCAIFAGAAMATSIGVTPAMTATIVFLLGVIAVLDLIQLSFAAAGVAHPLRATIFSILHVAVIGLALVIVSNSDIGMLSQLLGMPAAVLFLTAVAFSLPFGIASLPLSTALASAGIWISLAFIVFLSGGMPQPLGPPAISGELTGPFLFFAVSLLLASGFVGRLALSRAWFEADQIGLRRRRHDLLSHYVPSDMAWRLSELDRVFDDVSECDCAVLLVDISHFQRKMETAALVESGKLVQEFHELVGEVVFKNGGLLRHMEGDSLYAVFGLLEPDDNCVEPAVLCAQTMAEAARLWRSERIERGKSPADIYMGIDFGRCVIIPNSQPDRPDFSIVGAPFSAARRMERVARLVAADMAITGHAVGKLKEEGAGLLCSMMEHRGPQKVDDRRGVVDVQTWNMPLRSTVPVDNVA
ncbi:MAG: adenylate/guanylate cyclase domain-containing protein [Pseudomonadota bacterium]